MLFFFQQCHLDDITTIVQAGLMVFAVVLAMTVTKAATSCVYSYSLTLLLKTALLAVSANGMILFVHT